MVLVLLNIFCQPILRDRSRRIKGEHRFVQGNMGKTRDGKTGQEEEETERAQQRNCPLGTLQFCPYDGSIFPLCCDHHLSVLRTHIHCHIPSASHSSITLLFFLLFYFFIFLFILFATSLLPSHSLLSLIGISSTTQLSAAFTNNYFSIQSVYVGTHSCECATYLSAPPCLYISFCHFPLKSLQRLANLQIQPLYTHFFSLFFLKFHTLFTHLCSPVCMHRDNELQQVNLALQLCFFYGSSSPGHP